MNPFRRHFNPFRQLKRYLIYKYKFKTNIDELFQNFDNLDIEIATAVNYIINDRARSLPREDVMDVMKSATKEVKASDKLYMKMGLR